MINEHNFTMKENVFFYYLDKEANSRQGYACFIKERSFDNILFYCPSYTEFYKTLDNGYLKDAINFKKPHFRPATLVEIAAEGMLNLVQGVIESSKDKYNEIYFMEA